MYREEMAVTVVDNDRNGWESFSADSWVGREIVCVCVCVRERERENDGKAPARHAEDVVR